MSTEGYLKPVPGVEPTKAGLYLWRYPPNIGAAALFLVLFLGSSLYTCWKIWRTLEMVGYGVRAGARNQTGKLMPFVIQNIFILVAPVLFAASIYMTLGRIITSVGGDKHSLVKPSKITLTFVLGDVLSFVVQGGGAGMSVIQDVDIAKWAERVIIIGLVIQIVIDVPTLYIHGASHVSPIVDDAQRVLQDSAFVAERYSILHLELLDHLRSRLFDLAPSVQSGSVDRVLQLAYGEGLRVPYLMDQLLALAAAHKSTTVTGTSKHLYRTESARLQTRALAQASLDEHVVTRDNSLALFAFSSVLGQHVLFDVFSSVADLPTMLDKLVQCFDLHQGIRVTASKAWEKLQPMLHDDSLSDQGYMAANADVTATGTECNELLDHLEHSGLDRDTIDEYKETAELDMGGGEALPEQGAESAVGGDEWSLTVGIHEVRGRRLDLQDRTPEHLEIFPRAGVRERPLRLWLQVPMVRKSLWFMIYSAGPYSGTTVLVARLPCSPTDVASRAIKWNMLGLSMTLYWLKKTMMHPPLI
ncbi:hypothetical protein ACO1O0_002688 [Amphichorda felina]